VSSSQANPWPLDERLDLGHRDLRSQFGSAMAKQVAPERHQICEVVATLLARAGGMNERTDSRKINQLKDGYWQAVVA
jgi:hypothetical protein